MRKQELSKLHHCVFAIHFHLVLVTKHRKRCITHEMLNFLRLNFERLSVRWQSELLEFNGEPDHVHLLLSLNPKVKPSTFVNNLKTVSSRLIRRDYGKYLERFYRKPVFWSRSYCIISCGGAPLSVVKQYIEQQAGAD